MERNNSKKIFIWFIFIFSAFILLINFFYLELWYAKRNADSMGYQNGFHLFNTQYSIIYWTTKISYLSCLLVVVWSGFEVAGQYNIKYKPSFTFRYVAVYWIVATMVGESFELPSTMKPKVEIMIDVLLHGGNWFKSYGFFFSFIDFVQFISIHITIPILVLVYASIYRDVKLESEEYKKVFIVMNSMMIGWMSWVMFVTYFGVQSPYPVIDSTPNWSVLGKDGWKYIYQFIALSIGLWGTNIITYIALHTSEKYGWNGSKI